MDSLIVPNQVESLEQLKSLIEDGRYDEALQTVEELVATDPQAKALALIKNLLAGLQGDSSSAIQGLEELCRQPGFADAFGLPMLLFQRLRSALLDLLKVEATSAGKAVEPWSEYWRACLYLNAERVELDALKGLLICSPEDDAACLRLAKLLQQRPTDEAITFLEVLLDSQPDACRLRTLLAGYLQQKNKTALALRHLKQAVEANPKAPEPHLELARIFVQQTRYEEAEKELEKVLTEQGKPNPDALALLATCQRSTYRYDDALKTLIKALQTDPDKFTKWSELRELSEALGQGQNLNRYLETVLENFPNSPALRGRLANLKAEAGDPLGALEIIEPSGALQDPARAPALARSAAKLLLELNDSNRAASILETLRSLEPGEAELDLLLGEPYLMTKRGQEAEQLFSNLARNHPNERKIQIAWGRSLVSIGQHEKAFRTFNLASRLDPNDPESLDEQALALLELDRLDEAADLLKESAKKSDTARSLTLYALGLVYERRNLLDIGRDFYRQALGRPNYRPEVVKCWLRASKDLAGTETELFEILAGFGSAYAQAKLYLDLLNAVFLNKNLAAKGRELCLSVRPKLVADLSQTPYGAFLLKQEKKLLGDIAGTAESYGELELAREVLRYGINTEDGELQKWCSDGLERLDSRESQLKLGPPETPVASTEISTEAPTEEVPVESEEDPLLSLLSTTLPTEESEATLPESGAPASGETAQVNRDSETADLEPTAPIEVELEEAANSDMEPEAEEDELSSLLDSTLFPSEDYPAIEGAPPPTEPEKSLIQPEQTDGSVAEVPPPDSGPLEDPQTELSVKDAANEIEPVVSLEPTRISSDPVEADHPEVAAAESSPATEPESPTEPGKELLDIPMAVDFEPSTRRQLHFYEAQAKASAGLLNPETLAHLLLQSSRGSEPLDPATEDRGAESHGTMVKALLRTAEELADLGEYRGGNSLLKTALMYAPFDSGVLSALIDLQCRWADWLCQRNEYAQAVGLLREALQRNPDSYLAQEHLEAIYVKWMDWSDENGDHAAKNLLALYLTEEKASVETLQAQWEERQRQAAEEEAARLKAAAEARMAPPTPEPAPVKAQGEPEVEANAVEQPDEAPEPEVDASPQALSATPPTSVPPEPKAETSEQPTVAPEPVEAPPSEEIEPESQENAESPSATQEAVSTEVQVEETQASQATVAVPETSPEPVTEEPATESAEADDPLAKLEADPNNSELAEQLFADHADTIRDLISRLREKAGQSAEPIWLLLLARAFRKSGSETMAVIQYQKYLKVAPSAEVYEELAVTYEEIGKAEFAEMTRKKAQRAFG